MKLSLRPSIHNVSLLLALAASGASLAACGGAGSDGAEGSTEEASNAATVVQQPLAAHGMGAVRDDPATVAARRVSVAAASAGLPAAVDMSAQLPTPGDQGSSNSCVGWATGYAATSFHEKGQENWSLSFNAHRASPSFVWNQLNGGVNQGITIGGALSLLVSQGDDDLADFPFVANDYTTQPNAASLARAARFKPQTWGTIAPNAAQFKSILSGGNVIVIGIQIYDDFYLNTTTNTVYDTVGTGPDLGRHAVSLIGYDDARQAFRYINSWGTGYGDGGYGWLAYSFITNAKLAMDAYVLTPKLNNSMVRNGIDVNLDKLNDLVFHNGTTGETQVWYMNNATRSSAVSLPAGLNTADSTGWKPVAMADFNKDNKPDIFWHNGSTGASQIWYMDGTTRTGYLDLPGSLNVLDSTGWRFMGAADFNQDGKPDLFARNLTSGAMQIWLMDGGSRTAYIDLDSSLNTPDSTGWHFSGTGDFNQDGKTDIFWHNGLTGDSQVWYMNGGTRTGNATLAASLNVPDSSGWKISTVTDLNKDGKPDVLAHNGTTGQFQVWYMDGITRTSFANFDAGLNTPDSTGWSSLTE